MSSNINDIMFACHGAVRKVIEVTEQEFYENSDGTLTWDEWLEILEKKKIKNSFYINGEAKSKAINYLFYVDYNAGVYVPLIIPSFSRNLVDYQIDTKDNFTLLSSQIKSLESHQNKCMKDGNWISFYSAVPTTFSLIDFNKRAEKIADEELLEAFTTVYINIDYNCNNISKDVLIRLKKLKRTSKSNRKITVYRGQGELSPDLDSVYSWTTCKEVALKFAIMRRNPRCLYQAKVYEDDIIAKINDREEKEVIVLPEDVTEIKMIDFDESSREIAVVVASKHSLEYQSYKDIFWVLKESGFSMDNSSEHSLTHAARVLFYSLMISDEFKLSDRDKTILNYCAMYHDLGRDNEYEDTQHGKKSLEVIDEYGLPDFDMTDEDLFLANTIIEYHCKKDETGITKINSSRMIKNKTHAIKLYKIFKDLDALDRVRFLGVDIDTKYFRFTNIKSKLLIAASLNFYGIDALVLN